MKHTIAATEARNKFFEILNAVMHKGEEFVVEKDGKPAAKVIPIDEERKSPEEIDRILKEMRDVFKKHKKRKYWSVIDTPAWKKKERKYLENLSKGIID